MRKTMLDERTAYETIMRMKEGFGTFHKTCFHVHTPASYDYKLLGGWSDLNYKLASEQDIYRICIERNVFPEMLTLNSITLDGTLSYYGDKKEMLSYMLLAETIIANGIEIILVSDHHTIDGVSKLRAAIKMLCKMKKRRVRPAVLLGIEISCADRNHVVGIFDDNQATRNAINSWLGDYLLSKEAGTYETSIRVLEFIQSIKGIGYLAHMDTSDIFKEKILSGAYKNQLFSEKNMQLIGLKDYQQLERIKQYIKYYRKADIQVVIDNDAHDVDTIPERVFWIKGSKCNYSMVREAINDYDISISLEHEESPNQYIKGIYIQNSKNGFLRGNDNNGFCLRFSNALNCLIGGRGTGKSTVLEIMEYALSQRCNSDSKLDFICSHGDTWLLYDYKGEEYLIEMKMPVKQYDDDNVLHRFGQNPNDQDRFRYVFNQKDVEEFAFRHFLKISKITYKDQKWFLTTVDNKRDTLSRFFDVRYSVNELVNTASGEKINGFIYKTLFTNKTLSKPEDVIRFMRMSGLTKALEDTQNILQKREREVNEIITPFNKSQDRVLRIIYSQDNTYRDPNIAAWLFGADYKERENYKNYNIKRGSLVDYLLLLYDKLGLFEFLKLVINKDVDKAFSIQSILDFCTELDQNMVEEGVTPINDINAPKVLSGVFSKLVSNNNIEAVKTFLQSYVTNIESFSLEFNVNNREGNIDAPSYKPVGTLSLGQKVVAMLSFVLGYSEYSKDYRPLIIDQPEDNLDNQYIYKNLVKQLRSIKEKRQVIIATHNATIVTNAKADQVCVMCSDSKHGWIEKTGYPSEKRIKESIINYLEGGKESFLHKISIYEGALGIQVCSPDNDSVQEVKK